MSFCKCIKMFRKQQGKDLPHEKDHLQIFVLPYHTVNMCVNVMQLMKYAVTYITSDLIIFVLHVLKT